MTRKYSLVIEGEPGSYSAYVPEIETILVTGGTIHEITTRAKEAIQLYWEYAPGGAPPAVTVQEIDVELPA